MIDVGKKQIAWKITRFLGLSLWHDETILTLTQDESSGYPEKVAWTLQCVNYTAITIRIQLMQSFIQLLISVQEIHLYWNN